MDTINQYIEAYEQYHHQREAVATIGGTWVKQCRDSMSLRQFAKLICVTPSYLSKLERGEEPLPASVAKRILSVVCSFCGKRCGEYVCCAYCKCPGVTE
jgi:DNA-binding transcriptional regulator YiaG